GAVEGSGVLQESAENLHRDVARKEFSEDVFFVRLVFVNGATSPGRALGDDRRNELLRRRDLGDHRPEAREEQGADIELSGVEQRDDLLPDVPGVLELDLPDRSQINRFDDAARKLALELVEPFAANAEDLHVLAVSQQGVGAITGEACDRRV